MIILRFQTYSRPLDKELSRCRIINSQKENSVKADLSSKGRWNTNIDSSVPKLLGWSGEINISEYFDIPKLLLCHGKVSGFLHRSGHELGYLERKKLKGIKKIVLICKICIVEILANSMSQVGACVDPKTVWQVKFLRKDKSAWSNSAHIGGEID